MPRFLSIPTRKQVDQTDSAMSSPVNVPSSIDTESTPSPPDSAVPAELSHPQTQGTINDRARLIKSLGLSQARWITKPIVAIKTKYKKMAETFKYVGKLRSINYEVSKIKDLREELNHMEHFETVASEAQAAADLANDTLKRLEYDLKGKDQQCEEQNIILKSVQEKVQILEAEVAEANKASQKTGEENAQLKGQVTELEAESREQAEAIRDMRVKLEKMDVSMEKLQKQFQSAQEAAAGKATMDSLDLGRCLAGVKRLDGKTRSHQLWIEHLQGVVNDAGASFTQMGQGQQELANNVWSAIRGLKNMIESQTDNSDGIDEEDSGNHDEDTSSGITMPGAQSLLGSEQVSRDEARIGAKPEDDAAKDQAEKDRKVRWADLDEEDWGMNE